MRPREGGACKGVFLSIDLVPGLFTSCFFSWFPILLIFRPAGPNCAQEGLDLQMYRGWAHFHCHPLPLGTALTFSSPCGFLALTSLSRAPHPLLSSCASQSTRHTLCVPGLYVTLRLGKLYPFKIQCQSFRVPQNKR